MAYKHTFKVKASKDSAPFSKEVNMATSAAEAVKLGLVKTEGDWHKLAAKAWLVEFQGAWRRAKTSKGRKDIQPKDYTYGSGVNMRPVLTLPKGAFSAEQIATLQAQNPEAEIVEV